LLINSSERHFDHVEHITKCIFRLKHTIKSSSFAESFGGISDWTLLNSFCDDSSSHISVSHYLLSPLSTKGHKRINRENFCGGISISRNTAHPQS